MKITPAEQTTNMMTVTGFKTTATRAGICDLTAQKSGPFTPRPSI
ncbi:MAG TPA: hypothetical protein VK641_01705 [Terriglobales bacterium]|nr:hypothetical protein [Terriglobales bacterium]